MDKWQNAFQSSLSWMESECGSIKSANAKRFALDNWTFKILQIIYVKEWTKWNEGEELKQR